MPCKSMSRWSFKSNPGCLAPALLVALTGCVTVVDANVAEAIAGCEEPTEEMRVASPRMLSGWVCQACHGVGDGARGMPWTLSGTVFQSPTDACNPGGVDGVKVEILDDSDSVVMTVSANKSGNFFSADGLGALNYRARITKGSTVREMNGMQTTTACAFCHQPSGAAGGRISLD